MQELEKILEEIDMATDEYGMVDYINDEPMISKKQAKDIIRKHLSGKDTDVPTKCGDCSRRKWYQKGYQDCKKDNDGWIPVEDERLWNILFEEACVEGEQAMRIYNRLKETFGGERSDMDGKL